MRQRCVARSRVFPAKPCHCFKHWTGPVTCGNSSTRSKALSLCASRTSSFRKICLRTFFLLRRAIQRSGPSHLSRARTNINRGLFRRRWTTRMANGKKPRACCDCIRKLSIERSANSDWMTPSKCRSRHAPDKEGVNELTDCFSADTFPSLKRRGGCGINKKARSLRSAADGVVRSAKLFRPKDFADLFLRLRPIGLALRATPSARTKVASRHFLDRASTPPLQGGE